ncbi:MAG TPA: helical backbone metal receptor [Gemmatimonadaceae bacterium]|nr:helical backbone metal receptor [Gemmatimonadaceae bacterium]HRQ78027.1 helical backbone metal receptor [Gemmatimonadaceae bacterium]
MRWVAPATLLLLAMACGGERAVPDSAAAADEVVDDFGDTLRFSAPAQRIVSLNPVTTELLFALDAGDRVVGRTSWDLFPEAAKAVTDLGPGMGPNVEAVLGQRPDLVLLYASESNRVAAQQLRAAGVATLTHRTDKVADLQRVLPVIAAAIAADSIGRLVADSVRASVDAVREMPRPSEPVRAFWHIWDAPLLTIGGGSYMSELLDIAGAVNVFADAEQPSPAVSLEEVARRNPDVILAGPNNARKIRASPLWQAVPAVRAGRILVIDTTIVGRPGVRMGEAARFLRRALVDSFANPGAGLP